MDAAGSQRAVVFGVSEGGRLSMLFAASHPERTLGLMLFGTSPRFAWAPDFPWGSTDERWRDYLDRMDRSWGRRSSRGGSWGPGARRPASATEADHLADRVHAAGGELRSGHGPVEDEPPDRRPGHPPGDPHAHAGPGAGSRCHIGARVAGLAERSEVLVSSTVKDLVAGAAIGFEDRGERELKGVPGAWRVYRAMSSPTG